MHNKQGAFLSGKIEKNLSSLLENQVYEQIYQMRVKNDHRSEFSKFKQLERRSLKKVDGCKVLTQRCRQNQSVLFHFQNVYIVFFRNDFHLNSMQLSVFQVGRRQPYNYVNKVSFHLVSLTPKSRFKTPSCKGTEKRATCLATVLQNELNSDVARFTTHAQTC